MNKAQKEVLQVQLNDEQKTIKQLQRIYGQARKDCESKIRELSARTDLENLQSIIYQKQYQEALKKQLDGILDNLHSEEFTSVADYLQRSYENGYIGVMYDLHKQGIPVIMPINQEQVVKALQIDSKLSNSLYARLGEDVSYLKKSIRAELSRGVANGSTWNEMAKHIANGMNSPYNKAINNAIRIVRTEGHRIQQSSALHAQFAAKEKGADVLKQWDSTLDNRTRPHHRQLDGQIRELEEDFEVDGMTAPAPGHFGRASEDCNCRCCILQRARWALDQDELDTLKERAAFYGLDKTDSFDDFKKKYLNVTDQISTAYTRYTTGFEEINDIKQLETTVGLITGKKVDLTGTDLELMKKNMEQLVKLGEDYGYKFTRIESSKGRTYLGDVVRKGRYGEDVTLLYPKKYYKSRTALLDELKKSAESGNMPKIGGRNVDVYTTTHEFAHTLSEALTSRLYGGDDDFWDEIESVYSDYKKNGRDVLGKYASSNQNEFVAEAFSEAKLGVRPSKWSVQTLEIIDKYFKKTK